MADAIFLPPAEKFIKKLKDKKLKGLFRQAIDNIIEDYTIGEQKTGDLAGIYCYDLYYNKTNYEIAYKIKYIEKRMIIIIMAGTRENFYNSLKKYIYE